MLYLDECENNSLYCIIESIYLGEKLSDRLSNSRILVNPDRVNYISGKTIIINKLSYSLERCDILYANNCTIISRVPLSRDYIKYQPYQIRPDFSIMWNGVSLDVTDKSLNEIIELLENNVILDFQEYSSLYFPKLIGMSDCLLRDSISSSLTAFGWLMHQVGINTDSESKFQDMDLLKTKKMLF